MKTAALLTALVLVLLIPSHTNSYSQPYAPPSPTEPRPTPMGHELLMDEYDLRRHVLEDASLSAIIKRGNVLLIRSDRFEKPREEHSTNVWKKTSDALRQLGFLDRNKRRPQVRIVQRDVISQSIIDLWGEPKSGFEGWFLDRQLQAGDIVIVTPTSN